MAMPVAPQAEMVQMMIDQLETVFSSVKCPEYVSTTFNEFIAAMKRWAAEGK